MFWLFPLLRTPQVARLRPPVATATNNPAAMEIVAVDFSAAALEQLEHGPFAPELEIALMKLGGGHGRK